jgi:hypothetical protein
VAYGLHLPGRNCHHPFLVQNKRRLPVAECAFFWAAFGGQGEPERQSLGRDFTAITFANITSFGFGELLIHAGLF